MPPRAPETTASRAVPALIVVALVAGSLAAGLLVLAAGGGSAATALRADALPGDLAGSAALDFRLRDGRGGTVDTHALRGRPYALTFLYTHCPDVCPTLAADLRAALARAPRAAVVAVSVDPRGDTPSAVRAFAARHRLPSAFRYAIGDDRSLRRVWRAYFVSAQAGVAGRTAHTAAVWLVDARGRLRGMYPGSAPVAPADVAHDLRALVSER